MVLLYYCLSFLIHRLIFLFILEWSPIEDKGFFWWQPLERREEAPRTLLRQFFIPNEKPKLVSMMIYAGNLPYAEYLHALQGASALVLPLDVKLILKIHSP